MHHKFILSRIMVTVMNMHVQLEFNFGDQNDTAAQLKYLKTQLDAMQESMRKQTKKLFGEVRTLEKRCAKLEAENVSLKKPDKKIEWIFLQDDQLVQAK
jgi:uncharacterized membrane protein